MAITNHERVGKALELLKIGLGPFVEREIKNAIAANTLSMAKVKDFVDERAVEAMAYNGLVQSWPEITRLARESGPAQGTPAQADLL